MIIGIDLDNTLADFAGAFLAFWDKEYSKQFRKEDFVHSNFSAIFGVTDEELIKRLVAFDSSGAQKQMLPMVGSQATVAELARQHELHVITARPEEVAGSTHEWVEQHFLGMFAEVHFCSKDNGATYHRPKHVVCNELGAHLLIDDHPETVRLCVQEGIRAYLFDQPWNQSEILPEDNSMARVRSWEDRLLKMLYQKSSLTQGPAER